MRKTYLNCNKESYMCYYHDKEIAIILENDWSVEFD